MTEEREEGFAFLTFLAGAGLGALIGAATALLMAPQSGRESREELKEALGKVQDRTEELLGKAKDATTDFVQAKKNILGKAVQAYKEGAAEKKSELEKL